MRELAPMMGLSQASLFGYRSGKIPVSRKAWSKLEAVERQAGVGETPRVEDEKTQYRPSAEKGRRAPDELTLGEAIRGLNPMDRRLVGEVALMAIEGRIVDYINRLEGLAHAIRDQGRDLPPEEAEEVEAILAEFPDWLIDGAEEAKGFVQRLTAILRGEVGAGQNR